MFSILIVDDDPSDREGIDDLINWEQLSLKVIGSAVNGIDGCAKALEHKPDFILSDISMPLMDGLKMADYVAAQLPETKFIFMSCFDDFHFVQEALHLHAQAYVLKPINLNELTEALQKMVASRQMELEQELLLKDLKLQLDLSKPMLREHFFRDLLFGKLQTELEIGDYAKYVGIDFSDNYHNVIFIQIDNYDLIFPDVPVDQKFMAVFSMKKLAYTVLLKKYKGYCLILDHNSLILALSCDRGRSEETRSEMIDLLNDYKDSVNGKLKVDITIGVSEFTDHLKDMPALFEKAEFAVKSKFHSTGNRLILASEVKGADFSPQIDLHRLRNEIIVVLEQGQENDIFFFIDSHYKPNRFTSEIYIKTLSFSIVNIVQSLLIERNESLSHIFPNEMVIWERLSKLETVSGIRRWLMEVLEAVKQHLSRQSNSRYHKIVEDIKTIIHENYAEITNIDQIVKPLFISTSHANNIFKQRTGKTIFDFLIDKRMEIAKQMLKDPHNKIYEIAEKVGYKDKSYFGSVFKEYTGLTPKHYANKHAF